MVFFDYYNDLDTFNSLMENIKDDVPTVEDEDAVNVGDVTSALTEAAGEGDDASLSGPEIANAVLKSLSGSDEAARKRRNQLFRAAYYAKTYPNPFSLGSIGNQTITNDCKASTSFSFDGNGITVNFSGLVRRNSSNDFIEKLKSIDGNWNDVAPSDLSGFSDAIKKAAKDLEEAIDSDSADMDDADEEDISTPDETEADQKTIYAEIMKDYRANYQQNLLAECSAHKDDADEALAQSLFAQYYEPLIEPYKDRADEQTQQRVKTVVQHQVNKYLGLKPDQNGDEADGSMDWMPHTDSGETEESEQTDDDSTKKKDGGYRNWIQNTVNNWNREGVTNEKMNPNPLTNRPNAPVKKKKKKTPAQKSEPANVKKDEFDFT